MKFLMANGCTAYFINNEAQICCGTRSKLSQVLYTYLGSFKINNNVTSNSYIRRFGKIKHNGTRT